MTADQVSETPAVRTARAYFDAWTRGDLDEAMSHLATDFVCDAPLGRLEGAEAFRGFMAPFVQILVGARLFAVFGDDTSAVIVYDTETVVVKSAPAAEYLTVVDGKITYDRFIFDRLPFDQARQAAT